jgi:hypothetical protein
MRSIESGDDARLDIIGLLVVSIHAQMGVSHLPAAQRRTHLVGKFSAEMLLRLELKDGPKLRECMSKIARLKDG